MQVAGVMELRRGCPLIAGSSPTCLHKFKGGGEITMAIFGYEESALIAIEAKRTKAKNCGECEYFTVNNNSDSSNFCGEECRKLFIKTNKSLVCKYFEFNTKR